MASRLPVLAAPAVAAVITAIVALGTTGAPAHASVSTDPAPAQRDAVRFSVAYQGSGAWHTAYHSEPPNEGGDHDVNDVHDASTQRWSLRYRGSLPVGRCPPGAAPGCPVVHDLLGATGRQTTTGRIDHRHRDGLYRQLDSGIRCDVRRSTRRLPRTALRARMSPDGSAVVLTAENPVTDAFELMPKACPKQGDSLDLILDNYFGPGFSFDDRFDAARWMTSRAITLPVARLLAADKVRVTLHGTAAGRPPRHCAVAHRSFERCTTSGAWAGTLTLTARR